MKNEHSSHQSILLAEYTLGLLDAEEVQRAQSLLGASDQAVIAALKWESRFLELVDCLAPVNPPAMLLANLQATLGHHAVTPVPANIPEVQPEPEEGPRLLRPAAVDTEPTPPETPAHPAAEIKSHGGVDADVPPIKDARRPTQAPSVPRADNQIAASSKAPPPRKESPPSKEAPPSKAARETSPSGSAKRGSGGAMFPAVFSSIRLWRAAALGFALLALLVFVMPKTPEPPKVTVVKVAPTKAAILQAPGQTSTPGWLLSIGPEGNVRLDPKVHTDVPPDASVQLWTHNKTLPQPRSLGLIDPNQPVTVPFAMIGDVSPDQIFEMTLEAQNGSSTGSPSGPILFIGRVVTFGQ